MSKFLDEVTGKKFKCNNCKQVFNGENIKLKSAPENAKMQNFMLLFIFVDKDGNIMCSNNGPDGKIGDQITHCPFCDYPHLFGIDSV
jgi:hypothetical protein